jgi:hypothetical protein
MEVDTPLEYQVKNISEVIHGLCVKIFDLEACTTLSTPPKEREQWENIAMMTVESVRNLDEEYKNLYEETT